MTKSELLSGVSFDAMRNAYVHFHRLARGEELVKPGEYLLMKSTNTATASTYGRTSEVKQPSI